MARTFDGPLSQEDIDWLLSRYPEPHVQRLVELHGSEAGEAPEKPEDEADVTSVPDTPEEPENGSEGDEEDDEGDFLEGLEEFDVVGSTEAEVKAWAADAPDEAKAQALAAEQAREDREPRKGVVTLLS